MNKLPSQPVTPEKQALSIWEQTLHRPTCTTDSYLDDFRCDCDRPVRAMLAFADLRLEEAAKVARQMVAHADRDTPKAEGARWAGGVIAKAIENLRTSREEEDGR